MLVHNRIWLAIFLVMATSAHGNCQQPIGFPQESKIQKDGELTVQAVLGWLPPDTETLVVSQGPYNIEEMSQNQDNAKALPLAKYLERLSYLCFGVHDGAYIKKLKGQQVAFAVEGARNFRSPKQLGMRLYEGCHVLAFRDDLGAAGQSLRKALEAGAIKVQKIGRQDVFCFEEKLEQDLWKFYFVQPKPNVLLCATDQVYLTEVLLRIDQGGQKRALPDDLPEWKHVDKTARFWAIRHYGNRRPIEVADSPRVTDPNALGMVFSFIPAKKAGEKDVPIIKYLSSNQDAEKIATRAWTYFDQPKWRPNVRVSSPGVVEVKAALTLEQGREFLFLLLFHLGHGIAT